MQHTTDCSPPIEIGAAGWLPELAAWDAQFEAWDRQAALPSPPKPPSVGKTNKRTKDAALNAKRDQAYEALMNVHVLYSTYDTEATLQYSSGGTPTVPMLWFYSYAFVQAIGRSPPTCRNTVVGRFV